MNDEVVSSQLVIILDTNPVWWGQRTVNNLDRELSLSGCLDCLMVFANSHLMMNHTNKLVVMAAHTNESKFLYPKPEHQSVAMEIDVEEEPSNKGDGRYELFMHLDKQIKDEVKELVEKGVDGPLYSDSLIAGALSMALCYIHRMERTQEHMEKVSNRILVIKGSEDNPEQYMNLMNAVFTAQKQNVVIDACILDHDSGLLQQACDITGGIYIKIPHLTGLLQYLLWVFLPDPTERHKLTLPPKVKVDYRAACFCHRSLVDIGYVCSVCLSIFCNFSPICGTCHTTFKIFGPPKALKKKSKRQS